MKPRDKRPEIKQDTQNDFSLEGIAAELGITGLEIKEQKDTDQAIFKKMKDILKITKETHSDVIADYMKELLPDFVDHGFDIEVFKQLLPYAVVAYLKEKNGDPVEHAYKLTIAFGDKAKAIHYVKQYSHQNKQALHPFHDACGFLNIPAEKNWNLEIWRELIKKHALNGNFQIALENAARIEEFIRKQKGELDHTVKKVLEEEKGIKKLEQDIKKISAAQPTSMKIQFMNDVLQIATRQQIIKDKKAEYAQIKLKIESLPEEDKEGIASLKKNRNAIDKEMKKAMAEIQKIEKNYQLNSTMTPDQLFILASQLSYKNANINPEAAALFMSYHLSERQFEKYIKLKEKKADYIPDITVDGAKLGAPRFYLKKLNPKNPRAAILGKLTACCQSLGSQGNDCVIHGITSPYGGFYVVCKGDAKKPNEDDEIISQCWVWRSEEGNVVFDSIETQPVSREPKTMNIVNQLYITLACQLVESKQCEFVSVGISGGTPYYFGIPGAVVKEVPLESQGVPYKGYRDSVEQRLVADRNQPIFSYILLHDTAKLVKYLQENPEIATEQPTVLFVAIAANSFDFVKLIMAEIEKKADKERQLAILNNDELNPLVLAASTGNMEIIQFLLEKRSEINEQDKMHNTALISAANSGNLDLVKFLVEKKADVTLCNRNKWTPLHYAAYDGQKELVKFLLENKASMYDTDFFGQNPLDVAVVNEKLDMVKFLIEEHKMKFDQDEILRDAAHAGSLNVVKYMLQFSIDINKKSSDHRQVTPLTEAALGGNLEIVKLLVEHKADMHLTSYSDNKTALHTAAYCGKSDVVKYLVEQKMDIHQVNKDNKTVFEMALDYKDIDTIKYLIEMRADMNTMHVVMGEQEALIEAQLNAGNWEIVKLMIENGVKVNIPYTRGCTALHWAIISANKDSVGKREVVQLLIDKRVNVNKANNYGETPLTMAIEKSDLELVKMLVQNNADINYRQTRGASILERAQSRSYEIYHYLINIQNKNLSASGFFQSSSDTKSDTPPKPPKLGST